MTDTPIIGKGTALAHDLESRVLEIAGKMQAEAQAKATAKEIAAEIKEKIADAASAGFDAKQVRERAKEMALEPDVRAAKLQLEMDFEQIRDVYRHALGMIDEPDLALRDAAMALGEPSIVATTDMLIDMKAKNKAKTIKRGALVE